MAIMSIIGLPGAGKTITLSAIADHALKNKRFKVGGHIVSDINYDHVLTNFYCQGCGKLDFEDLGRHEYNNCLFLCDEIQLLCDSRSWKDFSKEAETFFSTHRHGHNDFVYCTQNYSNVDKRIRDLTQQYFYVRPSRFLPSKFSTIIPIDCFFDVVNFQPITGYEMAPFTHHGHIFLPKYWHKVDSYADFNATKLEPADIELW